MVFKRKCKRILSSLLALSTLATFAATTVCADDLTVSYDSSVAGATPTGYQSVTVELEKAETYSVTLPKSVVLDGTEDSSTLPYNVTATGEISSTHYVRVIPLAGAKLYNEDETVALDLDVSLTKRRWDNSEVVATSGSNETTGEMTVNDIEPGKWTGKIKFLVTLDDGGAWTPATCTTPATCNGYDTNDNGVIDADEQLATPITKGKPLGHKFADVSNAFPDTCERCKKMVYAISTPAQLTAFRDAVNSGTTFAGATVELNADIDMSETPWNTGIGGEVYGFKGTFDGHEYTISNLHITHSNASYNTVGCGLFNFLNSTGVIRNFTLTDSSVEVVYTGTSYTTKIGVGAVCGYVNATTQCIENVHVRNTNIKVTTSTGNTIGAAVFAGCVSYDDTTITNCSATGCSIYATGTGAAEVYTGGATGNCRCACTIKNSLFAVNSTIGNAFSYATGVAVSGNYSGSTTITNCVIDTASNNDVYHLSSSSLYATPVYSNCLRTTTADCQSQAAVDILNTDNTKTWVLDLENLNNGYPLIK